MASTTRPSLPGLRDLPALDPELMAFEKFDIHTHLGLGNDRVGRAQVERYIEDSARAGITRFAVSRPFTGTGQETPPLEVMTRANDMVVDVVKRYAGTIYGYVFVHPGYREWSLGELDRSLEVEGMIGAKLYHQYQFSDPVVIDLIRAVAERGALVLLHQGKAMGEESQAGQPLISDGSHIARLAEQVPEARLICGHIGGGGDWEWTIKALEGVDSVFVDTSGSVIDAGMIEEAARRLGYRRLLFATDMSVDQGIGKMLAARIPNSHKRAIFSSNLESLLRSVGR